MKYIKIILHHKLNFKLILNFYRNITTYIFQLRFHEVF